MSHFISENKNNLLSLMLLINAIIKHIFMLISALYQIAKKYM